MVLGIGCDIIEISRVAKAMENKRFLEKYYTFAENEIINKKGAQTAAGNFAAKEAVSKALGQGFGKISPIEIEILRSEKGAPLVNLYGEAAKFAEEMGIFQMLISISHSKDNAVAYAVGVGKTGI